ncbi:uncharacterized protein [Chelonus insularis]|uniref:uncharacterized protein n=1 Tax=Chelonus insularis TaxID=460826 RepID=UPI00158E6062|nr:uncharacterized protein LOC118066209 [Chelonus insularis]
MTNTRNSVETLQQDSFNNRKDQLLNLLLHKCSRIKKNMYKFVTEAKIYETMNEVCKYLSSHPILLAVCLSVAAAFIVPVFLFILFAVINVAFAFTGFIVIEVAIISVGATVICSILFCLLSTIIVLGIFCIFAWTIACYIFSLIKNITTKTIPRNKSL